MTMSWTPMRPITTTFKAAMWVALLGILTAGNPAGAQDTGNPAAAQDTGSPAEAQDAGNPAQAPETVRPDQAPDPRAAGGAETAPGPVITPGSITDNSPLAPAPTGSPRQTLQSFRALSRAAATELIAALDESDDTGSILADTAEVRALKRSAINNLTRSMSTMDLSEVAPANRRTVGINAVLLLEEILDRVPVPEPDAIPDAAAVDDGAAVHGWTIPGTQIQMIRSETLSGDPRYLFSPETVRRLPAFYEAVRTLPRRTADQVDFYQHFVSGPGLSMPIQLYRYIVDLPDWALAVTYEQATWQWIALFVLTTLYGGLAYLVLRSESRRTGTSNGVGTAIHRLLLPLLVIAVLGTYRWLCDNVVNLTGDVLTYVELAVESLQTVALAVLVLFAFNLVAALIIASPKIRQESLDASLIRLVMRVIGFLAAGFIIFLGATRIGLPVYGIVAGLGVGGLAIALAVRPTLENFIGGIILYADRPVKVGDFCQFGDMLGTVEEIGLRSTKVRSLNRTLVTVQNSEFSQMSITNFSRRDANLMQTLIRLRHETTSDQLTAALEGIGAVLKADPRVKADTVRVVPARHRRVGAGGGDLGLHRQRRLHAVPQDQAGPAHQGDGRRRPERRGLRAALADHLPHHRHRHRQTPPARGAGGLGPAGRRRELTPLPSPPAGPAPYQREPMSHSTSPSLGRRIARRVWRGLARALALTSALAPVSSALACTRLVYLGAGDTVITARSMDWKTDVGTNLWAFPRGMARTGNAGANSIAWTSQYGSVVASAYDISTTDGMNEAGLVANVLWLVESEYPPEASGKPGLTIAAWAQYVLDNFATVAEAVTALRDEPFAVVTDQVPGEGRLATLHLSMSDASGDSAIVEYIDGRQVIHHSRDHQVMTNSPTFDKQLALNDYWSQIGGTTFLPGTNRAADRFARASFYVGAIPKFEAPNLAVAGVFSVIRNVSVPYGIATPDQPNISSTRWRTLADHARKLYFFESALTPNTFWVDLTEIDFSAETGETMRLDLGPQQANTYAGDATGAFTPAAPFTFLGKS